MTLGGEPADLSTPLIDNPNFPNRVPVPAHLRQNAHPFRNGVATPQKSTAYPPVRNSGSSLDQHRLMAATMEPIGQGWSGDTRPIDGNSHATCSNCAALKTRDGGWSVARLIDFSDLRWSPGWYEVYLCVRGSDFRMENAFEIRQFAAPEPRLRPFPGPLYLSVCQF